MRFLVDAQLPPALSHWLSLEGYDAQHVMDCGLQSATDSEIWDYALRVDAAIVTKDEDFARRRAMVEIGPRIVWIRVPNVRRQQLLSWFQRTLPDIIDALDAGETLIEIA